MKIFVSTLLVACLSGVTAWSTPSSSSSGRSKSVSLQAEQLSRRSLLSSAALVGGAALLGGADAASADDEVESGASIVSRAAKLSAAVGDKREKDEGLTSNVVIPSSSNSKSIYDFTVPVAGDNVPVRDFVHQTAENDKVKAILVVNIKQDDPLARKNIPELITLASKYGRNGEFVVICSPTDQGYYEPDTSTLIRLKLEKEYGYGINPATTLTDKMNILGSGAHPFWRYLEGTCRTPAGLGRIEGNFEKFLVDGATGRPVRRYPRKYQPKDIEDDIVAILGGKSVPPAGSNFKEEWRVAANDAERDTYRFQKGLNVFDQ